MGSPEKIDSDRRSTFAIAALPLLVLGLGSRAGAAGPAAPAAPACYDPKSLSAFQTNQRATVKFRVSTDPMKRCGVCMYYSGAPDGCGKCQILLNGPVGATNLCDSWAKKG